MVAKRNQVQERVHTGSSIGGTAVRILDQNAGTARYSPWSSLAGSSIADSQKHRRTRRANSEQ